MTLHPLLATLVEQNKLPQALLFTGRDAAELLLYAQQLAATLLGSTSNHPDLILCQVEGKSRMHSAESMRELIQEAHLPPFQAACKVLIIEEAERMLPTSSNTLLKTLEEPPHHCHFILLAEDPQALLPTIVSRLRKIVFPTKERTIVSLEQQVIDLFTAPLSVCGQVAAKIEEELKGEEDSSHKKIDAFLETILLWYCDLFRLKEGLPLQKESWRPALQTMLQTGTHPASLEHAFDRVETCRQALQVHVRLKSCLHWVLSSS